MRMSGSFTDHAKNISFAIVFIFWSTYSFAQSEHPEALISKVDGYSIAPLYWSSSFPQSKTGCYQSEGTPIDLRLTFAEAVEPKTPATSAFNKAVREFELRLWNELGGPPLANPKLDGCQDIEIDYALNPSQIRGIISIAVILNNYTHGAAHGEFGADDFNWDVAKIRPVEIEDIFDLNSDWKTGLIRAVDTNLKSQNLQALDNSSQDIVLDVSRWAILKSGLRIDSDVYEFGPYSDGEVAITIPWTDLKPYLKKGGLVLP